MDSDNWCCFNMDLKWFMEEFSVSAQASLRVSSPIAVKSCGIPDKKENRKQRCWGRGVRVRYLGSGLGTARAKPGPQQPHLQSKASHPWGSHKMEFQVPAVSETREPEMELRDVGIYGHRVLHKPVQYPLAQTPTPRASTLLLLGILNALAFSFQKPKTSNPGRLWAVTLHLGGKT